MRSGRQEEKRSDEGLRRGGTVRSGKQEQKRSDEGEGGL